MIGFRITDVEIDAELLLEKIGDAKRRTLKILGFEIREVAQRSIVDARTISRPGMPPHGHVGTLGNLILYSVSPDGNRLVVGPQLVRKKSRDAVKALEHGGTATNSRGKVIRVQARPFMEPAFNRVNRSKVPAVFANSVQ